jgi:3'(2'), 5'-bisphosphate nucleotidase
MLDLAPIKRAIQQAAALCLQVQQRHLTYSDKGQDDPVTIADYGAQALICRAIQQHFPGDAVLAEEQGAQFIELVPQPQREQVVALLCDVLSESVSEDEVRRWLDYGHGVTAARTWVIDPVDGTKGFLAMRHYAIAIGLLENGQPIGGVLSAPGYKEGSALFWALNGQAYRQSLEGGTVTPIRVSQRTDPAQIRIVQSMEESHTSDELITLTRQHAGLMAALVEKIDSMEKYALVACDDADLYLRLSKRGSKYGHKAWDHAAGTAIVLAAGGRVSDLDGAPLDFSKGSVLPNQGMIVSNGLIHERVVAAVQAALNEGV